MTNDLTGPTPRLNDFLLTDPEFALRWPLNLFKAEAARVARDDDPGRQYLLCLEAFSSPAPAALIAQWSVWPDDQQNECFVFLVEHADWLRPQQAPTPLWRRRQGRTLSAEQWTQIDPVDILPFDVASLINDFWSRGYLSQQFPTPCVDDREARPLKDPSLTLESLLGWRPSWPVDPNELNDHDNMFDLIEAIHDLVARPRATWTHDFGDCGVHYSSFAQLPGQALYRWEINQLLESADIDYQLADDGEDSGRLVTGSDQARTDLIHSAVARPGSDRAAIAHAISLFRRRDATEKDKQSACVALAGVLEGHRAALRTELWRKDEGALFQIANEFQIRHNNPSQHSNYDPAWLDLVFWWYLAAIELHERIGERDRAADTTTS